MGMDNHIAIKELIELDGRFRLVTLGWLYLDPIDDPIQGVEPIFGAVLKGTVGPDGCLPGIIIPLAEEFAAEDPEIVARNLLEIAQDETENLFAHRPLPDRL